MSKTFDVMVTVKDQKGFCGHGHKVGDSWVISGKTPAGICLSAFAAILPAVRTYAMGGSHPWESDPDATYLACQDAANPVVFEIRRIQRDG